MNKNNDRLDQNRYTHREWEGPIEIVASPSPEMLRPTLLKRHLIKGLFNWQTRSTKNPAKIGGLF